MKIKDSLRNHWLGMPTSYVNWLAGRLTARSVNERRSWSGCEPTSEAANQSVRQFASPFNFKILDLGKL